jgi:phosphatidylglycerophosphate synthase
MSEVSFRDKAQQGIYKIINPFVRFLIRLGLTPNAVTSIGLVLNMGVAIIFILGAERGNKGDLRYIGWAGCLILFAGLFDMLDGQVARLGKMSSTFGALYDSVLDRYSELILFLGICYYLISHHYFLSSLIAFIAMIGSIMVSYTRARSEGLGIENKGGLMQRPERVILIALSAIATGIAYAFVQGDGKVYIHIDGARFRIFELMTIFTLPITVLAILTNITAVKRLMSAKKALDKLDEERKMKINAGGNIAAVMVIAALLLGGFSATAHTKIDDGKVVFSEAVDTFPIPKFNNRTQFYVQRTPNTNTIMYELNMKNGTLDDDNPVHVYWIRYANGGGTQELSFIQRKFAYGVKVNKLAPEKYKLLFAAYDKIPFYLMKSTAGIFHTYVELDGKMMVLNRIYIRIDPGGTFWAPNVKYVEFKVTDIASGKTVIKRINPKWKPPQQS